METLIIKPRPQRQEDNKSTDGYQRISYVTDTPSFNEVVAPIYGFKDGEKGSFPTDAGRPIAFTFGEQIKVDGKPPVNTVRYVRWIKITQEEFEVIENAIQTFVTDYQAGKWLEAVGPGVSLENLSINSVGAAALDCIINRALLKQTTVPGFLATACLFLENQHLAVTRFVNLPDQPMPLFSFEKNMPVRKLKVFNSFAGRPCTNLVFNSAAISARTANLKVGDIVGGEMVDLEQISKVDFCKKSFDSRKYDAEKIAALNEGKPIPQVEKKVEQVTPAKKPESQVKAAVVVPAKQAVKVEQPKLTKEQQDEAEHEKAIAALHKQLADMQAATQRKLQAASKAEQLAEERRANAEERARLEAQVNAATSAPETSFSAMSYDHLDSDSDGAVDGAEECTAGFH